MWILPTFNRPTRCAEVLASIAAHGSATSGVVVVNGPEGRADYERIELPRFWRMVHFPENVGMNVALNRLFESDTTAPFYGFLEDDAIIESDGWDERLTRAAFPWSVSHGDDGWQSARRIHGAPCVGGELARAVGALAIGTCWHWYGFDAMWEALDAELSLRVFCSDVKLDHRHHLNRRATKDHTYDLGACRANADLSAFNEWRRVELPRAVERVRKARP